MPKKRRTTGPLFSKSKDLLKLNLKKGVLRMLNRFGLVIHWIGFIASALFLGILIFALIAPNGGGVAPIPSAVLTPIPLVITWAIRFILTGHKGLMPWSKAKQPIRSSKSTL